MKGHPQSVLYLEVTVLSSQDLTMMVSYSSVE